MKLDLHAPRKVKFDIVEYVHNIMDNKPDDMEGKATIQAANHIFSVNDKSENLLKYNALHLHTIISRIIFLYKRAMINVT